MVTEAGEPGRRVPFSARVTVTMIDTTSDQELISNDDIAVVMSGSIFAVI